jgi:fermentation-respiration switch protein FrsA (DUF1100 family)
MMARFVDRFIFPGKYGEYSLDYNRLYRIPRTGPFNNVEMSELKDHIPFIFLKNRNKNVKNLVLFFHGNSEEATSQMELLEELNFVLDCNSALIEYPGYGVSKDLPKSPKQMLEDSEQFYKFFTEEMDVDPENIIIFGRSLGTGPATYLASKVDKCKMLLLMSPYTGLVDIFSDKWYLRFIRWLFGYRKEHFNNLQYIKNVTCPVFMLHGKKDTLIYPRHSEDLGKACNRENVEVKTPANMTHNRFHVFNDLLDPVKHFMKTKVDSNKSITTKSMKSEPDFKNLEKYQSRRLMNLDQIRMEEAQSLREYGTFDQNENNVRGINNSALQKKSRDLNLSQQSKYQHSSQSLHNNLLLDDNDILEKKNQ